jgi:anti-sigma B factor antagonist
VVIRRGLVVDHSGGEQTVLDPTTSQPTHTGGDGFAGDLGTDLDRPGPGVAVLAVRGEIDSLTTPTLQTAVAELLAGPEHRLVIDLSGVSFLASSGLAVLIRAAQEAAERGARLRLVGTGRPVRRPLEVTGSDQLFDLFNDRETAIGDPV